MSAAAAVTSKSGCEFNKSDRFYSHEDLVVRPVISDDDLGKVYCGLKEQGTFPRVFYEYDLSLREFLVALSEPIRATLGCYLARDGTLQIMGLSWLNRNETLRNDYRRGDAAMCFLRGQPIERLEMFGKMAISWAFDKVGLDVLTGSTPAANRAAILFSKRLGFDVVGPIPAATVFDGKPCDIFMSSITREKWHNIS